jgi:hypothetical protein
MYDGQFSKHGQYCLVLKNGSIVLHYKADAVVVAHCTTYRYHVDKYKK